MTCTDVREGMAIFAIRDIKQFGVYGAFGSVALGSEGTIERLLSDGLMRVKFNDCQTGETIKGDLFPHEVWNVGACSAYPRQERKLPPFHYGDEPVTERQKLGGTR